MARMPASGFDMPLIRPGGAPHHVGHREIDHQHPERHEQQDRGELHALGDRADDQRGRDDRDISWYIANTFCDTQNA